MTQRFNPWKTRNITYSQWTDGIREFLRRLASLQGYQVTTETKAHGNQRFDQTWSKDSDTIAIEYENNYKTIHDEVEKLCKISSCLKILITYVPEKNCLADALMASNSVAVEIDKKAKWFNGEFLLVIGGYEWNDWAGIRFVLKAHPGAYSPLGRTRKT